MVQRSATEPIQLEGFEPRRDRRVASDDLGLSVIIPVHNGGAQFRTCLERLTQSDPPPSVIVVVTDGDTDGSRQVAEQFGVRVIQQSVRRGPASARNLGARAVRKSDLLLFVDADVAVERHVIGRVASMFKADPSIAAVIGSYDDEPAAQNFYSQFKNLFHHYTHQTAREEASTFWGACGAIRRGVFDEVGGFDERYRDSSIEDVELGYRLKRAGYRIRLCKSWQVKHLKHWTARLMLKSDFLHRALPWTELIHREGRLLDDLNLTYTGRLSGGLAYGLLVSLAAAAWWPSLWPLMVGIAVWLFALNVSLYRFFYRKRGAWFALRAVPCHWLYYVYSGLAFGIGTIRYRLSALSPAPSVLGDPSPRAREECTSTRDRFI